MEISLKKSLLLFTNTVFFCGCSYSAIHHSSNGLSYYMQSDKCQTWSHIGKHAVCYDSNGNYTTTVAPLGQQQAETIIKQEAATDASINNSIQMMNQSNQNMQMQMLNNQMFILNNQLLLK
jgi:hypothetical protein